MQSHLSATGIAFDWDNQGGLHFWGEVVSTSAQAHRWVKASISLLDSSGSVLAEGSDILALEWLPAGERVPFHVVLYDAPANWSRYSIALDGHVHDYDDPNVPQPAEGLVIQGLHYREINRAGLICSLVGLLKNTSSEPVSHVKVCGALYSAEGEVVAALSPYIVPSGVLEPGTSLPFELKYYLVAGAVANYSVTTQGRAVTDA